MITVIAAGYNFRARISLNAQVYARSKLVYIFNATLKMHSEQFLIILEQCGINYKVIILKKLKRVTLPVYL